MNRLFLSAPLFLLLSSATYAQDTTLTYVKDIAPVVKEYCVSCHMEDSENPSLLLMETFEELKAGGKNGPSFVPGKPKESNLYLKLLPEPPFGRQMPRGRKKLPKEDVQLIYEWIKQGARKE